jgi:geranylgeranyl reductase family protein
MAAREAALAGLSVAVLEEDSEIGTPEHCGGLVSMAGLRYLGVIPDLVQNSQIKKARILSPNSGFEVGAEKQKVVVVDRRALDKQVAFQAQKAGAEIRTKCSVRSVSENVVKTSDGDLTFDYFVDARGVASIINRDRNGVLQSAQYEVYADWIERDTVEVAFDSQKYPGFFAWIIPISAQKGKVGVAGRAINAASALKSYMDGKGRHSIIRKVYAPIWVNGPLKSFVQGRTVIVGDAAGQTKPTTAGGIYSCGIGGLLAGRAIAKAQKSRDDRLLLEYDRNWFAIFGSEFDRMLLARKLLERMDSKTIDEVFAAVPKEDLESEYGEFDFHSAAISKILKKSAPRLVKAMLGNELRRLFESQDKI